MNGLPHKQGLYDPANEHDACGLGFVVNIKGEKSHDIILKGIQVLINLTHRGACGCDPETGDGAGILIQIPHAFFARECGKLGFTLPPAGVYGVGMVFLPVEPQHRLLVEGVVERIAREEGLTVLGWRDTPVNAGAIRRIARGTQPYIEQIFVRGPHGMSQDELERKLYIVRKRAEVEVAASDIHDSSFFYIPSLSSRTIVYKGLLLAPQIAEFYKELSDPEVVSAHVSGTPALLNQYISYLAACTPLSLHLSQRRDQHCARQRQLDVRAPKYSVLAAFRGRSQKLFPLISAGRSDSACLDNAVELLTLACCSLPHVMAMLIPKLGMAMAQWTRIRKRFTNIMLR